MVSSDRMIGAVNNLHENLDDTDNKMHNDEGHDMMESDEEKSKIQHNHPRRHLR